MQNVVCECGRYFFDQCSQSIGYMHRRSNVGRYTKGLATSSDHTPFSRILKHFERLCGDIVTCMSFFRRHRLTKYTAWLCSTAYMLPGFPWLAPTLIDLPWSAWPSVFVVSCFGPHAFVFARHIFHLLLPCWGRP